MDIKLEDALFLTICLVIFFGAIRVFAIAFPAFGMVGAIITLAIYFLVFIPMTILVRKVMK